MDPSCSTKINDFTWSYSLLLMGVNPLPIHWTHREELSCRFCKFLHLHTVLRQQFLPALHLYDYQEKRLPQSCLHRRYWWFHRYSHHNSRDVHPRSDCDVQHRQLRRSYSCQQMEDDASSIFPPIYCWSSSHSTKRKSNPVGNRSQSSESSSLHELVFPGSKLDPWSKASQLTRLIPWVFYFDSF